MFFKKINIENERKIKKKKIKTIDKNALSKFNTSKPYIINNRASTYIINQTQTLCSMLHCSTYFVKEKSLHI